MEYCIFNFLHRSEKSSTLPFENRKNIAHLAISPNGLLLLSIDEGLVPLRWNPNDEMQCWIMLRLIFHSSSCRFLVSSFWQLAEGRVLLINLPRRVLLHHFNFKQPVSAVTFSPNGRFFAVALSSISVILYSSCIDNDMILTSWFHCSLMVSVLLGRDIEIWRTPGLHKEFALN